MHRKCDRFGDATVAILCQISCFISLQSWLTQTSVSFSIVAFSQWIAFPSAHGGPYQAELTVREPSVPRLPTQVSGPSWTNGAAASSNPLFDETCTLPVNIKLYCKKNDPDCEVFYSYRPNQCKGHVDFCAASQI